MDQDPNREVSIVLLAHEWNAVLDVLAAEGKYRIVAPLIGKILSQGNRGETGPVSQLRPVS